MDLEEKVKGVIRWRRVAVAIIIAIVALSTIWKIASTQRQKAINNLKKEQADSDAEDKKLTALEADFRLKEAAIKKEYQDSIKLISTQYDSLKAQDKQVVVKWREVPSKANCELVIASKDKVIKKAESKIKKQQQVIASDSVTILSLNRTIANKDETIAKKNNTLDKSITLAENKSRPKRFGLGLYAGMGVTTESLKPLPSAGVAISYNLIRW